MKTLTTLLLCLSIGLINAQDSLDTFCFSCICEASSGCYTHVGCIDGGGTRYCGPYLLSWGYWFDAGKPGLDFEKCATNTTCAETAIKGYMKRYGKDCDGDGIIDCEDFARIHKKGRGGCSGDQMLQTDYWIRFEMCYASDKGEEIVPDEDYGEGMVQERKLKKQAE